MNGEIDNSTKKRLQEIGHEIKERIETFDQLDAQCTAEFNAVAVLMDEAFKLCGSASRFAEFKHEYCGNLGRSRMYELLAIKSGIKTEAEIKAANRRRTAKSRSQKKVKKQNVTDNESVTLNGKEVDVSQFSAEAQEKITKAQAEADEVAARAETAAPDAEAETAAEEPTEPNPNKEKAAAILSIRKSAHNLDEFKYACSAYLPKLIAADLEKANEHFQNMYKRLKVKKAA